MVRKGKGRKDPDYVQNGTIDSQNNNNDSDSDISSTSTRGIPDPELDAKKNLLEKIFFWQGIARFLIGVIIIVGLWIYTIRCLIECFSSKGPSEQLY